MDDPKKINPADLSKPLQLQGSVELFDINILPERYRRSKVSLINVLPWLILIILIGSFYPLMVNAMNSQEVFLQKQVDLLTTQAELKILQTNTEALENIQNDLSNELERRDQILESYGGINLQGTSWSGTLLAIYAITPSDIILTSVTQQDGEILLEGIATSYQLVIDYSASLKEMSGLISTEITSMEQVLSEDVIVAPPGAEGEAVPSLTDPTAPYMFTILSVPDGEVLP